MKPTLFIGSSSEGLRIAQQVQFDLQHHVESRMWNQGVFGLGWTTIEGLMNEIVRHDFAILVLSADDFIISREEKSFVPRDNVLFELGLFMGRLGPKRTFVLYNKSTNLKILSDLRGLTLTEYDDDWARRDLSAAIGTACQPIRRAIEQLGPLSSLYESDSNLNTSTLFMTAKEIEANGAMVDVIENSDDLFIAGVALGHAVKRHRSYLIKQVNKGGRLRILLLNPNSPDVVHIAKTFEIDPSQIKNDILSTLHNIEMLKSKVSEDKRSFLQVKLSERELPFSFIISNPQSQNGFIQGSLRAHGLGSSTRPNWIIKMRDRWFSTLLDSCETLWHSSKLLSRKAGVVAFRFSQQNILEVLLITARVDPTQWIFPVGEVEPGEILQQAAIRECQEESGYITSIGSDEKSNLGIIERETDGIISQMTFFLAKTIGQANDYEDDRKRKWIPYEKLLDNIAEDFKSIAYSAIDLLDKRNSRE